MGNKKYGAEEARAKLPDLLEQAHHGQSAVITKRGKPYAAIVPVSAVLTARDSGERQAFRALKGTGKGLWRKRAVAAMRDEWDR